MIDEAFEEQVSLFFGESGFSSNSDHS